MTKTGVWNCSAKSKASMAMEKHSSGEHGKNMGCLVSPCESSAVVSRSPCCGARGQAGGGADALHVEDHRGNLGVVAQADELRHQRDARAGGGGHGARARPAGAERHADGGQFVFRLHDGVGGLAGFRIDAEALHVADQRFHQRRRGRDGIPGDHRHAGEHAAQRAGRVAVDDDLAGGRVHALHAVRIGLGEGLRRRNSKPAWPAPQFSSAALAFFLPNCLTSALWISSISMESSCATTPS